MNIAAGIHHTVALNSNGTVQAWGFNGTGQLGDNTTTDRYTPVPVTGPGGVGTLSSITAMVARNGHTVALKSDGTVWAWGYNFYGQLGYNTVVNQQSPVQASGPGGMGVLIGVAAVAAGFNHTVALKSDGTVWAWGSNVSGQLGNNTTTDQHTPVQVNGPGGIGVLSGVTAVAAGAAHTVALKSDGTVCAWGWNSDGQLGDNTTMDRHTPVQVSGPGGVGVLSGVTAVAADFHHTVALKSDGTVWAWGGNGYGQLGNNTTTSQPTPVQVSGPGGMGALSGVTAVAAGAAHTVALKSDGTVWTWGRNASGQLGDNTSPVQHNTPVQVSGPGGVGVLSGVTAVAVGFDHTVALKSDGTVWAWGYNSFGELGYTTTVDRHVPVQVSKLSLLSMCGSAMAACNPGTGECVASPVANGTPCNDGDACSQPDTCQSGACTGIPTVCLASDECHTAGTCDATTGVCPTPAKPESSPCDDGNACTQADTCQSGLCTTGTPVVCTASDDCHDAGVCDTMTGVCSTPAKSDGATCSLGTCQAGICTPSPDAGPDGGTGGNDGGLTSATGSGGGLGSSSSSSTGGNPPEGTIDLSCRFGVSSDGSSQLPAWLGAIALLAIRRRHTAISHPKPQCF